MESGRGSRNPAKDRAMFEAPTEKSCLGFPADSHSEGHRRFTIHRHMCFPCSCLFTLCVAGGNQGIIHDPPLQHPAERGKQRNIPVKCQMFGRALRAADGFGGETGNSSGAGSLKSRCRLAERPLEAMDGGAALLSWPLPAPSGCWRHSALSGPSLCVFLSSLCLASL